MRRLLIATKNAGKVAEVTRVLRDLPFDLVTLESYPHLPEVDETGATFRQNAILKASTCARATGELALADDSGLEVDALGGAPGVMSARFAANPADRNAKLLDLMRDVPDELRTARFRCVMAIAEPAGEVKTCEGTVEGLIARDCRGERGFGYDPIFILPENGRRMAELEPDEKNAISHRGRALAEARAILAQWAR